MKFKELNVEEKFVTKLDKELLFLTKINDIKGLDEKSLDVYNIEGNQSVILLDDYILEREKQWSGYYSDDLTFW